jgi:hypothetical protein
MAAKQISDSEMDAITKSTAELLKEQPQVRIRLYLSPEEKKKLEASKASGKNVEWPSEFVSVNGHSYQIQKGVDVDVPETVRDILEEAGLI